jgi:hypothetical protein
MLVRETPVPEPYRGPAIIYVNWSPTGYKKTMSAIAECVKMWKEGGVTSLFLTCSNEVAAECLEWAAEIDYSCPAYQFFGKCGGNCDVPEGKRYIPGCKQCSRETQEGCEYKNQFAEIEEMNEEGGGIVFAHIKSRFLALKYDFFHNVVIDESFEGSIYETLSLSPRQLEKVGIEVKNLPTKSDDPEQCADCVKFEGKLCRGSSTGLCTQVTKPRKVTFVMHREPEDDDELFVHQTIRGAEIAYATREINSLGNPGKLVIMLSQFFPVLHCDTVRFNSATVSMAAVRMFLFNLYVRGQHTDLYGFESSDFVEIGVPEGDARWTYSNYFYANSSTSGTVKTMRNGIKSGTIRERLRRRNVPMGPETLLITDKREFGIMKRKGEVETVEEKPAKATGNSRYYYVFTGKSIFAGCLADYYLSATTTGSNKYRHCTYVALLKEFRYPPSIQFLLATVTDARFVHELQISVMKQTMGRIRFYQDADKVIFTDFYNPELMKECSRKERITKKDDVTAFCEELLGKYPNISTERAHQQCKGKILIARNVFLKIFNEVKKKMDKN